MRTRKTVSIPWRLELKFRGGETQEIEFPANLSSKTVWRYVRESFPSRPSIRVLVRGRKQAKLASADSAA
jgi:hypothetical protein